MHVGAWHVCMCVHIGEELTSNVSMHADIEVVASQPTTNEDDFQFMSAFLHGLYDVSTAILDSSQGGRESGRERE